MYINTIHCLIQQRSQGSHSFFLEEKIMGSHQVPLQEKCAGCISPIAND